MALEESDVGASDWNSPKVRAAVADLIEAYGRDIFMGDGFAAAGHVIGFGADQAFVQTFLGAGPDDNERGWPWRLHSLVWAAKTVLSVPGDFVECGVFRGFMSLVVCRMLQFEKIPRTFWLFDTFAGLAAGRSSEQERGALNDMYDRARQEGYTHEAVKAKFALYPNVKVVQGVVPDVFATACPRRIAYLHIDMNAAEAEVAALDALFDKVSPGGIVLLDDYGRLDYAHMHAAERQWFRDRGYPVLELPTGQGLVVKR